MADKNILTLKETPRELHDKLYYAKCFFAGLFPCGLTHTLLTPMDIVKCRRQIQPEVYKNLSGGVKRIWGESGVRGLYLGWQPTLLGYSAQGSTKYGFYEIFKDMYRSILGEGRGRTLVYLLASASAEVIADCFLCPMESLKVRMQTSTPGTFPDKFLPAFQQLKQEGSHGFYKGLLPLIFRQVPNTMIKFATYENAVRLIYTHIFTRPKTEYSTLTQLLVTFSAGYTSGVFSCFISNPADIIVSKLNQKKTDVNQKLSTSVKLIYQEVGLQGLWRGFSTRVLMVGTFSALEWLIYDFFKVMAGLQTTGGR